MSKIQHCRIHIISCHSMQCWLLDIHWHTQNRFLRVSRNLKNELELSLNGAVWTEQISMFKWFLIIVSKKEFVSVGEVSVLLQNTLDTLLPAAR